MKKKNLFKAKFLLAMILAFCYTNAICQTIISTIAPTLGNSNGLDLTTSELWISDASGVTEKYTTGGSPLGVSVTAPVNAVSVDPNGELHVLAADSVRLFESDGTPITGYEFPGVDVHHNGGFYYVLDGSTVGMYGPGGANIGGGGSFSNAVSISYGLFIGNFIFADNGSNEVVVMDAGLGSVITTVSVIDPNGAAFLSDGRIVVAHSDSISFYQDDGAGYYLAQSSNMGGTLSNPSKMEVNLSDEIYLLDEGAGTIIVIDPPQPVLPIILSGFEARIFDGKSQLIWRSETEINASGFEVQHSLNGRNFEPLGFVEAKGSNESYNYSHEPNKGINYYRLRQIDLDGFEEYSETVTVNFKVEDLPKAYPNPSNGEVKVNMNASVYSIDGSFLRKIEAGQTQHLEAGEYIIRFENGESQKLIVK